MGGGWGGAKASQVRSTLDAGAIVPGSGVDLSSWLRGWCERVFSAGFLIRVSGSNSAPMFGRVYVKLRRPPPRSFHLHGVLGARGDVSHLPSRFVSVVLTLPSIPFRVADFRVPTMCNDSTVVASVNLQDGTLFRFLCLLTGCLIGWFECLDLHLHLVICRGSPLFWRISAVGIRLWGQRGLST